MNKRFSLIHLIILLCLLVFTFSTRSIASQKDGLLKIWFLDVGQGDAALIESPTGNQILIDGGPDKKVLSELGEVMPFYDRNLDMVIVSHHHSDHIGGLTDVLERYEVGHIIEAGDIYDSAQYRLWRRATEKEGAIKIEAVAGKVFDIGNAATITIIYPFKSFNGVNLSEAHDVNVTAILRYKDFETMFTGDMELSGEVELMANNTDIEADVLKVGHHGSKTSTSFFFLNKVNPQAAIIEVGENNRYGHPTQEILNRLENNAVKYYRTDINGTVTLVTDGKSFKIKTERDDQN